MREHVQAAIGTVRPLFLWPVPIKLDPVVVGVAEIEGLADAVIRRSIKRNSGINHSTERGCQLRSCWIQNGDMIQPGRARWRRLAPVALPCVQSDVMVVTSRRQKRGLKAIPLGDFKPDHIPVKCHRTFKVGHLQVNVTDPHVRIFGIVAGVRLQVRWMVRSRLTKPAGILEDGQDFRCFKR